MNFFKNHSDTLAIAAFLALSATYAALIGFVSPDSWNYVQLAQSISSGNLCEVNNNYFAVFPCGYPITLAISSFASDSAALIVISKYTNAALLLCSFLCFKALFSKNNLAAALIVIAPSTISISHYTWSENLFLFATALTLLQINRIGIRASCSNHIILGLALIIGISSRYFFAPFIALVWFSTIFIYGKKTAIRLIPSFAFAGLIFVAYYILNIKLTGFGTGMQRIPAPESIVFLALHFMYTLVRFEILPFLLTIGFFSLVMMKTIGPGNKNKDSILSKKGEMLVATSGLSFLLLSFVLRANTQFDLYGFRTVGYGLTFFGVAIYALYTKTNEQKRNVFIPMFLSALFAFCIAIRGDLKGYAASIMDGSFSYSTVSDQIKNYERIFEFKNYDNVISFSVPSVGRTIASNSSYYYGYETKVLSPSAAPYGIPETLESFLKKIRSADGSCIIDFSAFPTKEDFVDTMRSSFDVDLVFSDSLLKPQRLKAFRYDRNLAEFFIDNFQEGKVIGCSKLFAADRGFK